MGEAQQAGQRACGELGELIITGQRVSCSSGFERHRQDGASAVVADAGRLTPMTSRPRLPVVRAWNQVRSRSSPRTPPAPPSADPPPPPLGTSEAPPARP